jgi:hypothetical protein
MAGGITGEKYFTPPVVLCVTRTPTKSTLNFAVSVVSALISPVSTGISNNPRRFPQNQPESGGINMNLYELLENQTYSGKICENT